MTHKMFTKSAFKQALICPASMKYYHDSDEYANQNNNDDFLQALADGGNQAGNLAKVYYGIAQGSANDIDVLDYDTAKSRTDDLMRLDEVNIAEADFSWKNCFVRADIIEKKVKVVNLIDVTAECVNQYLRFDGYGRNRVERDDTADNFIGESHVLVPFLVDDVCTRIINWETGEQKETMGCTFKEFVDEMLERYAKENWSSPIVSDRCFKCPFFSSEKTAGMKDGREECWKKAKNFTEDDFAKRRILQVAFASGNDKMLEPFRKNIRGEADIDPDGLRAEMNGEIDDKGMRPNEKVLFHFTHYIIEADGTIRHEGQRLHFPVCNP